MLKKIRITVNGLVQGVGYRYFCYRKAVEYNITGYAKNLFDGSVEVMAVGDESLIMDFVKELKIGPSNSFVKSLTFEELIPDPADKNIKEYKTFKML